MRTNEEARQEAKTRFLDVLQDTLSVAHAAKAAGVSRKTPYNWRLEDAAFAEA